MSGGHFDYKQYEFQIIADEIDQLIWNNEKKNEWGYARNYSKKTLSKFEEAKKTVLLAQEMVQRVDWLVSGDDGEGTFYKRWEENISKLNKENE